MGVLGSLLDTTAALFQGTGLFIAIILMAVTWPVITATTKWLVGTVVVSSVVNDVVLINKEYGPLDVLIGMALTAGFMGVR